MDNSLVPVQAAAGNNDKGVLILVVMDNSLVLVLSLLVRTWQYMS